MLCLGLIMFVLNHPSQLRWCIGVQYQRVLERRNSRGLIAASVYIGVGMLHTLIPLFGGLDYSFIEFVVHIYVES